MHMTNWFHQDCAPRPYSPTFFCVWLIFQTRKTIPNQQWSGEFIHCLICRKLLSIYNPPAVESV